MYDFKLKYVYIIVRLYNAHLLLDFNAKKHPKQYKNQYTYVRNNQIKQEHLFKTLR
jgi:hypothetical protein